jgi:secreted trypsin-like serine protease
MKRMTRLVAFLAGLTALVLVSGSARAITNGTPDGNTHPAVGALVADFGDGEGKVRECSGSLIAPRVFLTAAHCVSDLAAEGIDDVWVTFAPVFTPDADLIHGEYVIHPEFRTVGVGMDIHDLAVVLLDRDPGVTAVQLPFLGQLDTMNLKGQTFTAVGYGDTRTSKKFGPHAIEFNVVRMWATQSFKSLQRDWLQLSQNLAKGEGGTCFGDSGGPHFLGGPTSDVQVSITITGDEVCRSLDKTLRLDTPTARQFLGQYVTPLP